jgi:antitoxin VapB
MKIEAVRIQNIDGNQAIQLPDELRISDDKVYLKKMGNVIYIIPYHTPWQNFFDSLSGFSADFMNERNQPSPQNRELFD